mmetsp:Transcript_12701/g.23595  ORF Transcript_12701/g.23595 Transcript_12701/m.23595 type:complete len:783 (-) Transcript_12701:68-2416(-)
MSERPEDGGVEEPREKETERRKRWSVLMISADPSTQNRLKLQNEERAIRKAIEKPKSGVEVDLDVLPAATIDDVAERLLRMASQGKSYDIIHFSGHCDQEHHLVQLIFHELARQHGPEVLHRFKSSSGAVQGVHKLAHQVARHLESQSKLFMDEFPEEHGALQGNNGTPRSSNVGAPSNVERNDSPKKATDTPLSSSSHVIEKNIPSKVSPTHEIAAKEENIAADLTNPSRRRLKRSTSVECCTVSRTKDDAKSTVRARSRTLSPERTIRSPAVCHVDFDTKCSDKISAKRETGRFAPHDSKMSQAGPEEDSDAIAIHDEEKNPSKQLLVFSHGEEDAPVDEMYTDSDSLVLRLPDVGMGCAHGHDLKSLPTKDIVLTKLQILDAGVGSLAFESNGDTPGMNFVGPKAFAALLSPYALDIGCVLLNACNSILLSEQILSVGIPFSVCSEGRMEDVSALHFSRGFYEAIGQGHDIERAFVEGRNRVSVHEKSSHDKLKRLTAMVQSGRGVVIEPDSKMCLLRAHGRMLLNPVAVRKHHMIGHENVRLRAVIKEGVKLLDKKDSEIQQLKEKVARLKAERERTSGERRERARVRDNKVRVCTSTTSGGSADRIRTRTRLRTPLKQSKANLMGESEREKKEVRPGRKQREGMPVSPTSRRARTSRGNASNARGRSEDESSPEFKTSKSSLPPWLPVGAKSGDQRRYQASTGHGPTPARRRTATVFSADGLQANVPLDQATAGLPQNVDHGSHGNSTQPRVSGFGSSVPRFSGPSAPYSSKYTSES